MARAAPGRAGHAPRPDERGRRDRPDVAHGAQSVIEEQVTNGVAVRMALLYLMQRAPPEDGQ